MHKQFKEQEVMDFVAEHVSDIITVLKQTEGTSKVYVITYLLATVREEALTALGTIPTGALLPDAKPQSLTEN